MAKNSLRNKKILITCGPTWVPIDNVRVISNRSTGQMGHVLARDFERSGARVTLLEGPCTDPFTGRGITVRKFQFYDELRQSLKEELKKKYDIVIHAAAVSDYRLKHPYRSKLRSGISKVNLALVPTRKIINEIRELAPRATLIGFKLEPLGVLSALRKKGKGLARQADCDFVVANSLRAKPPRDRYLGYINNGIGDVLTSASSRAELSRKLINVLENYQPAFA